MKIIKDFPPNIVQIKKVFNIEGKSVVFTYGNVLYNPGGFPIEPHLMVHEETHAKQQTNPKEWWERYLKDAEFRVGQELEAYRAQYAFVKRTIKDRELVSRFLQRIARDLSSEIYGNSISFKEAINKIKMC